MKTLAPPAMSAATVPGRCRTPCLLDSRIIATTPSMSAVRPPKNQGVGKASGDQAKEAHQGRSSPAPFAAHPIRERRSSEDAGSWRRLSLVTKAVAGIFIDPELPAGWRLGPLWIGLPVGCWPPPLGRGRPSRRRVEADHRIEISQSSAIKRTTVYTAECLPMRRITQLITTEW
jgi:hypothetical protein